MVCYSAPPYLVPRPNQSSEESIVKPKNAPILTIFFLLSTTTLSVAQNCPQVTVIGAGCDYFNGASGPQLTVSGGFDTAPTVTIEVSNLLSPGLVALAVGSSVVPFSLGDCTLWTNLDAVVNPVGPHVGGVVQFPIPATFGVLGTEFLVQAAVMDSGHLGGWALSDAHKIAFNINCANAFTLANELITTNGFAGQVAFDGLSDGGVEGLQALMWNLGLVDPTLIYAGVPPQHQFCNTITTESTIAEVLMACIDSILLERKRPYLRPKLRDSTDLNSSTVVADAVSVYLSWWSSAQFLTLSEIQAQGLPLDGASQRWVSKVMPTSQELLDAAPIVLPVSTPGAGPRRWCAARPRAGIPPYPRLSPGNRD